MAEEEKEGEVKPRCKPCDCKKGLPLWLGTFGDLMSLLLCFFVLLLSMATFDRKKLNDAQASLGGTLSMLEGGTKVEPSHERMLQAADMTTEPETTDEIKKVESMIMDYNEMTKVSQGPSTVMDEGDEGFLIRLPAHQLFKDGSATIEDEYGLLFIKRMATIIDTLPKNLKISVRGHTDNMPLSRDSIYRDNWELSAFRALSVARVLIQNGIDKKRLEASGFSEFRPINTNSTPKGREKNRRVDIHFYSEESEEIGSSKSILDKEI